MDDLISNYIDKQSFESDTQFAIEQLSILETAYNKLKDSMSALQSSVGVREVTGNTTAATASIKELTAALTAQNSTITQSVQSQNNLKDSTSALAKEKAKLAQLNTDEARQIAELKVQQQLQSKANKDAALDTLGLKDSYKQLSDEYLKAAQYAKNLSAQAIINPALAKEAQEATTKAKGLSDVLKTIDSSVGQFQRNVGNYTGAVSILQKGFTEAKAQLDSLSEAERNNTQAGQQLQRQVEVLGSFSQQQSEGFRSLTTELRNSERALRSMYEAGLSGTPVFNELQQVVNKATLEVREFSREQTLLQSESPAIAGLTAAARGLGGAYAIGAGAAALFADGNEKVEKELNKLVAIMTVLQGLTEFNRFLQEREAIAKSLNAVKTTFLSAAQKLLAITTGDATLATIAQAEAQQESVVSAAVLSQTQGAVVIGNEAIAVSSGEAATGLEAGAVGADTMAAGLDAVAVSEDAVAVGAGAMATAIAATGIGLIIVGLGVAIYKIAGAIEDWNAKVDSAKQVNEDLVATLKDLTDATKEYLNVSKITSTLEITNLQQSLDKRKALGITQEEQLKLESEIAQKTAASTQEVVNKLGVTKESLMLAQKQTENAAYELHIRQQLKKQYEEKVKAQGGDKDYKDNSKIIDDNIANAKKEYDAKKANLDLGLQAFNDNQTAQAKLTENANDLAKLSADDARKFTLETIRISANDQIAENERILSNDKSTLAQKLVALKSNLEEQKSITYAENRAIQNDPTISGVDKTLSTRKTFADIQQLTKEENQKEYQLIEEARVKKLQLTTETEKDILNVIIENNKEIYNNDSITEAERLAALKEAMDARKRITESGFTASLSSAGISAANIERIKKEGFFEIANKKITDEELVKLITEYNIAEVQIIKDSTEQRIKIVKDYYEKEVDAATKALRKIQQENDNITVDRADTYSNEIIELNDSYARKLISLTVYNEKRKKIDEDYTKSSIQDLINNAQKTIAANKEKVDSQKALQDDLNNLKNVDTSKLSDPEKIAHDNQIKLKSEELKAAQDTASKQASLEENLSKLKSKLSDEEDKELKAKQTLKISLLAEEVKIAQSVQEGITGLVDEGYQRQINAIQRLIDLNNYRHDQEIKAINESTLSNQEKAAQMIVLDNTVAANNRNLERQKVKAQIQQAKFDRDSAILSILENAAVAEFSVAKGPLGLAEGIGIAVAAAASIAMLLAKPLPQMPQYKMGKTDNYEGPAIVGDGGVSEFIKREDGSIQKTPAESTMTYLSKSDIVYPNFMAMMKSLAMPELKVSTGNQFDESGIVDAITRTGRMTVQALRKQKGTNVNVYVDSNWNAYISKVVKE
jgi:hypothetical protein